MLKLMTTQHYHMEELDTLEEILSKLCTKDGQPVVDTYQWVFLSTSGVHGTNSDLDFLEAEFETAFKFPEDRCDRVTITVYRPRTVCVFYGHVVITPSDIPLLRRLVRDTLTLIALSQEGNV